MQSIAGRNIAQGERQIKYGWWNPGDAGINVSSLPLRLVDGMPAESYIANLANKILDVRERGLYARKIIAAGTTVKKGVYQFFDKTKNDSDVSLDGSLAIDSLQGYTNLIENGKVAGGHNQIVETVQARVVIPTRQFNALDADIQLPAGGTNKVIADTKSATNSMLALMYNTKLTFSEPDYGEFASGPLWKFPAASAPYAAFGGATQEGFVANVGLPNYLRFIRVLQEMHHFDCELEFACDTEFPQGAIIDISLDGLDFVG
jgi:hypothetical protein